MCSVARLLWVFCLGMLTLYEFSFNTNVKISHSNCLFPPSCSPAILCLRSTAQQPSLQRAQWRVKIVMAGVLIPLSVIVTSTLVILCFATAWGDHPEQYYSRANRESFPEEDTF